MVDYMASVVVSRAVEVGIPSTALEMRKGASIVLNDGVRSGS